MSSAPTACSNVSERLKTAIADLRSLQAYLLSDDLDPRLLCDFRDAVNRVRNVAWVAQQSAGARVSGNDPTSIDTLLAAERLRSAYQLCRAVSEDLSKQDAEFQKGQLSELQSVVADLAKQLKEKL